MLQFVAVLNYAPFADFSVHISTDIMNAHIISLLEFWKGKLLSRLNLLEVDQK